MIELMDFNEISRDLIQHGNITFVPVLHGRLEYGVIARRLFHYIDPDAVAVEYPSTIQRAVERGLGRLPFISVVHYEEKNGRFVYLPLEPQDAQVAAGFLARKKGIPLHFIDRDTEGYSRHHESWPDSYVVRRIGLKSFVETCRPAIDNLPQSTEDQLRNMTMAYHLQKLQKTHQRILCVLGMAHYPEVIRFLDQKLALPLGRTRREGVSLANLAAESSREIMSDMPFLAAAFVRTDDDPAAELDRLVFHRELIDRAREKYYQNDKEEINLSKTGTLFKFARNYAIVQGHITPDLYQLLVAARGVAGDNFAYEVWDLGSEYPWQEEDSRLPTLRLSGEDLYLDTKKIRFYRQFRRTRRRLISVPIKKRKREKKPGEWKKNWQGNNICSYQPEDIVVEGLGDYMKKKTVQILSEENRRTQPFVSSMLDGLDMRETIRNWHEGKLYVTETRAVGGRVGSVVVIFDEDNGEQEKYPWLMSWLGEHEQESDMAFYSTPAGENVVGPGISKCEYGGFMLTYPPLRVYNIWEDSFFDLARKKHERLLLAGIDYSEEKLIAYVAARPPSDRIKSFANLYGKKVVYLPLGQFSPVTLKKVRTFHVLDGHLVRQWANEYIY